MRRHSSPAMGMSGISNSQVSRVCPKVENKVKAFPGRSDRGRLAVSAGRHYYVPRGVLKSRRSFAPSLSAAIFLERAPPVPPEGPGGKCPRPRLTEQACRRDHESCYERGSA
jgi:hypothetical protein